MLILIKNFKKLSLLFFFSFMFFEKNMIAMISTERSQPIAIPGPRRIRVYYSHELSDDFVLSEREDEDRDSLPDEEKIIEESKSINTLSPYRRRVCYSNELSSVGNELSDDFVLSEGEDEDSDSSSDEEEVCGTSQPIAIPGPHRERIRYFFGGSELFDPSISPESKDADGGPSCSWEN